MNAAARILPLLRRGEHVFLPGSAAEVTSLSEALARDDAPAIDILSTMVPGINPGLRKAGDPGGAITNAFASGPRGAQSAGTVRHLPLSYAGFLRHVCQSTFDTTVVQVAPPLSGTLASFGLAVEFTPVAVARSRRVIAVVNPNMPWIPGAEVFDLAAASVVVESDEPLREYDVGTPAPMARSIAVHIASHIGDGAAIQVGLGKVPDALLRLLTDRRKLRLQSGMLSDGAWLLTDAGALDDGFLHTSCVHVGTHRYYEWLRDRTDFGIRGCDHTHDAGMLGTVKGLVAINSALSIDLFGQANLEMLDGRAISGVGGAADFARAAAVSATGISIVALPSTSGDGSVSRIVPQLGGIVSLPRHDIDVVVTEFGAADLRKASVIERGHRLIAIADPRHQPELDAAWREIARKL